MSMTLTLNPQKQSMAEWVKIFPQQVTESYTSSVTFMKQLTVVAISTITYLKNLCPQDSFTTEHFNGARVQILKKRCENELAQFVSSALMQAFDAFDKKYLHQLAICFYDDECKEQNLIEYHIFEYAYHSDGVSMNVKSKTQNTEHSARYSFENVKERTIRMIRACVVLMESCEEELPPNCDVSLRLYYNKDAPDGYQAPGFLHPNESRDHLQSTRRDTIKLGCVETPFHKLTLRSYVKDNFLSNEPAITSNDDLTPVSRVEDDFNVPSSQKSALTSHENRIQCPCNKTDSDDVLLTCQVCRTQQHAACFGILTRTGAARPERHCCVACSDADPGIDPTDPQLVTLSVKRRESLCVVRRALAWCSRSSTLAPQELMQQFALSRLHAAKLVNILHTHQVVQREPHSAIMSVHQVNVDQLQRVICLFFSRIEDDTPSCMSPYSSRNQSDSLPEQNNVLEETYSPTVALPRIVATRSNFNQENDCQSGCNDAVTKKENVTRKRRSIGSAEADMKTKRAKARAN